MEQTNIIGQIFLGKYQILKLIDEGGMFSSVYLAKNLDVKNDYTDKKFNYVALKFITRTQKVTDNEWKKIVEETTTFGRLLKSPYIVQLESCFLDTYNRQMIVFSMEYLDGGNLKQLVRKRGNLSLYETISIFKKIIKGLNFMHEQKRTIIHRDLKPENILLSKDLIDVKISDFGIASVIQNTEQNSLILSDEKDVYGTIAYITPDILKKQNGKIIISKQFDFHALGIIFYEMLVGEKPFYLEDENDVSVISYFQKYDINPLKKANLLLYDAVENIFLRLTSSRHTDSIKRYESCSEILRDIEKLEASLLLKTIKEEKSLLSYDQRHYQKTKLFDTDKTTKNFITFLKHQIHWLIGAIGFIALLILIIVLNVI